jgi:pSer/pThr/pTyr-binding forkhead associated (FHA) protein
MNEKPVIVASEGDLAGQQWTVDTLPFLIGRGSDCQIVLPERQVSRHHVRITREAQQYYVHDLDSKNGTHLNRVQVIGQAPLHDGDEITVALCVKLLFVGTDATLPLSFEEPSPEGNLVLDPDKRSVTIGGELLTPPLSLAQFRLLEALYEADGAVVERDDIIEVVWPGTEGIGVSEQAIDALVRRLRDRLAELDNYEYVVTVRGHGFRIDNKPH